MKKFVTEKGVEHGLIETIANSVPDHGYKNLNEKNRKEMLERKKTDLEYVDVEYYNLKNQENGKFESPYGDHPGAPIQFYRLLHGHRYSIPRGLARKINALGAPKRSGLIDVGGRELLMDGKKERTHQVVTAGDL